MRTRGPRSAAAAVPVLGPVLGRVLGPGLALVLAACTGAPEEAGEPSAAPLVEAPAPGTLALAERALAEARYGDARALLDRVLVARPDDARARLLAAELLLVQGAAPAAAEAFARLAATPEVGPAAFQGRGLALILLGECEPAGESLRRAVAADPSLWRAWNGLAYCHDLRGAWRQAEASYANGLAARPDSPVLYNNRGFSRLLQRRFVAARADLERALHLNPGFQVARENLRLVVAWQGDYAAALAGASDRERVTVLNNIGFVALLRGDYASAEAFFLRALELDPRYNERASRNLATLYEVRTPGPRGAAR